jgi:hypothetical protein
MSQSNAAAIKRRVNVPSTPSQNSIGTKTNTTVGPSNGQPPTGFTLPQVIAVIDSRLTALEKNARDGVLVSNENGNVTSEETVTVSDFSDVIDEFNSRFAMFAEEISEMKDIILKLQSYTMEVNKTLMEERVRILSDMDGGNGMEMSVQEVSNGGEGYTMSK